MKIGKGDCVTDFRGQRRKRKKKKKEVCRRAAEGGVTGAWHASTVGWSNADPARRQHMSLAKSSWTTNASRAEPNRTGPADPVKVRCEESLQVGVLLSIIYTHPCYIFLFSGARGVDQGRAWWTRGLSQKNGLSQGVNPVFILCLDTFKIYFQTVMCFVVCRPKTLLEFKNFLYFIFKSLCAFVRCRKSRSVVKYGVATAYKLQ